MRAPLRGVENKSDFDLVTETDKMSENLILGHLKRCFPTHKFIGEESAAADVVLTDEPTWMVDPLDGTTNLYVAVLLDVLNLLYATRFCHFAIARVYRSSDFILYFLQVCIAFHTLPSRLGWQ